MQAPDMQEVAFIAAIHAAASNGLRGLLAVEAMSNPEVGSLVAEINEDGVIDVRLMSTSGHPIGGYSL